MLTTLEIINDMLASTGITALSVGSTSHPHYVKANNKLNKVNRVFQGRGWWFNKCKRTLIQNGAGEVVLPSNTMHADPVDTGLNLVMRAGKLWNMGQSTHVIGQNVEVWFVELVAIPDMPPTAQTFLQAKAVHAYYVDGNGGDPRLREYRAEMDLALALCNAEHLRNSDVNFFNGAAYQAMRR